MRLLPGRYAALPRLVFARPGLLACWIFGIALLETLGRTFRTETADLAGEALLLVLLAITASAHARQPLPWLARAALRVRSAGQRLRAAIADLGPDLRGVPLVPRGIPPLLLGTTVVLLGAVAGLLLVAHHLPGALRAAIAPLCTTLWIAILLDLHCALTLGIARFLWDASLEVQRFGAWVLARGGRSARGARLFTVIYLLAVACATTWVPTGIAVAALPGLTLALLVALHLPGNGALTLLWRPQRGETELRAIAARTAAALALTCCCALVLAIGLLAAGGETGIGFGQPDPPGLPLTTFLGRLFLWSSLGVGLILSIETARVVQLSRCLRPRAADGPTLYLTWDESLDDASEGPVAAAESALRGAGWRIRRPPRPRGPLDVSLHLSPECAPLDPFELEPSWPLRVRPAASSESAVQARLARRRVLLLRRQVLKGFERLFKQARRTRHGRGLIIGLQHWFQIGVIRDEDPQPGSQSIGSASGKSIVGLRYQHAFLRAARLHYAEIARALEVDLVYVEEGLGFRRFRRALGVLFETYDIHGGAQRIEERHFIGLPGTRAVVHEYSEGHPAARLGPQYPEPEFEHTARARVLHLLVDRGGDEVRSDAPTDLADLPAPVLV